jgi:predicted carbohydrate-binding protein with CBM5 and CBM33 domain
VVVRRIAAVAGAVALVGLATPVTPAFAHGATTTPVSRTAACASGGSATSSAACKAARAANGGAFGNFDNLRVPGVDGDDRSAVPDGELCGGGLSAFNGLNIARDDFPATAVTAGATLKIKYRTTIPHRGSFRIYLTRAGYDPAKKLTWDDLGSKPLADVADPPVVDGAFVMGATLPTGRTGRHLLYIVWETSDTPDTYYSCSDVVFRSTGAVASPSATPTPTRTPSSKPSPTPSRTKKAKAAPVATTAAPAGAAAPPIPAAEPTTEAPAPQSQSFTRVGDESQVTLGHRIIVAALVVAFGVTAWAVIGLLRRKRFENR